MKILISSISVLTATLFKPYAHAQESEARPKFVAESSVRLNAQVLVKFEDRTGDSLTDVLNRYGISADAHSQVFVHQEYNEVDITCFNCIVSRRGFDEARLFSENELVMGKTTLSHDQGK
jgi:hypothetical protein